ncbi:MAG: glycosyltransferase, partial [Chloroflexota bacterium]|nr:glycosyltransferase [Chloroflexota bacterium]
MKKHKPQSPHRRARHTVTTPISGAAREPEQIELHGGLQAAAAPLVIWTGPVFDPSGYASALRRSVQALDAVGVRTHLEELRWSQLDARVSTDQRAFLQRLMNTPKQPGEPYLRVWQVFPTMFKPDPQALAVIGRPYFETDRLPPDWAQACNQMDLIWVASDFNVETFARSGVAQEKLRALPDCIDARRFGPQVQPAPARTDRSFNFLSIFEWIPRKGWDVLIRAWAREFKPDEDVALCLHVYSTMGKDSQSIAADIKNLVQACVGERPIAPIAISTGVLEDDQLPALYRMAQAYVQPSRGEGWGHPLMEAMSSGLPTIGTRWSANLAFMNDRNSYLIDCRLVDVPRELLRDQPYYEGHRWAEPSVEHVRALMREVFEKRSESAARGAYAAQDIARRFNPLDVGRKYEEACREAAELGRHKVFLAAGVTPSLSPQHSVLSTRHSVLSTQSSALGPIPVVWEGGFFETHSLALVNRELTRALLRTGEVELSLRLLRLEPERFDPRADPELEPLLNRLDRP